tara:strand:- start:2030 stop:2488 length:459 start_codon:yes stop_codon:yes gene_type:complete
MGVKMRGMDETSGSLFSYVDFEERIPARHPLRKIRQVVNDALASLDGEFAPLYADFGRPSIAPERLIRASLIQILFSVRVTPEAGRWHDAPVDGTDAIQPDVSLVRWSWHRRPGVGRNGVHQKPGSAADDGHVAQGDGGDPGAPRGGTAVIG